MFRFCLAISLSLVIAGCAREQGTREAEAKNQTLTGEAAKRALLEMDGRHIPAGVLVPPPKDEPIQEVGEGEISIGRFHCNLRDKKFHASAFYPNADFHKFNDVSGVFERNAEGRWVAKITDSSSTH